MGGEVFSFTHPLWLWLGAGAVLLMAELATGSSWLLWPAVCAGLVGVLAALGLPFPVQDQIALFAVLSVASTFASRGLIRRQRRAHPDADDVNELRLPGRPGEAVAPFVAGRGRVLVDGAEWRAELDGGGELAIGACVEVVERLDGARLKVRAV